MKNKKMKIIIGVISIILVIAFIICYLYESQKNKKSNYAEINVESTDLQIEYTEKELTGEYSEYTAKIYLSDNGISIDGNGATLSENTITIKSAGTYYITGNISDGNIVIEAGKKEEVQLVLENTSITSKTTAPINCISASKLVITLAENSENTVTDSNSYTTFTDTEKEEPDGAIFSKTDLVINGNGKLVVNANYSDGIVSKDGLKIINSNIEINSADDGIRGKDYVVIKDANITITSKGDGIKSTNDSDTSLGYVAINGGKIKIITEEDGIQAEIVLNISSDAEIDITTSGKIASKKTNENFGFGRRGEKTNTTTSNTTQDTESTGSSKGLKAGKEITIESGNINVTSTDDSIHSNEIIIINGGSMKLSSGDDAIHADLTIAINGGNINIEKSYEGIEAKYILINDGTISVIASDDGINVYGGSDTLPIGGKMQQNSSSSEDDENRRLVINGGNITVNADGDGLDANGSIYINGGNITVAGSINGGNAALDYDDECVVTGGNIIIYGPTGMWQNPSNTSTQYSLTFQATGKVGDEIVLKDSSGNEVISLNAEKAYGTVTISNSVIEKGETYTLYVNGTSVGSLEASSIVTSNFSSNNMQQPKRGS